MSSEFVITPVARPVLPVVGTSALFPVRRAYCIGRNYAAHAREMGGDPTREPPFFFNKAGDALQPIPYGRPERHPYPSMTSNYHHEIEMVVVLKSGGVDIPESEALNHVFGYAVGFDMTRRDLQDEAKNLKRPWEVAKSADASGPVGPIHPVSAVGHVAKGFIRCTVDGVTKQDSDLSHMIWSVSEQIAILSKFYRLEAGDVIFSGTPEGVGRVDRGQRMTGAVEGLGEIVLDVA